jgi:hypothetical protein
LRVPIPKPRPVAQYGRKLARRHSSGSFNLHILVTTQYRITREWSKVAESQKEEIDALVESKIDGLQWSSTTSKKFKKEKKKGKDAGSSFRSWGMESLEPVAEPESESWLESTTVS